MAEGTLQCVWVVGGGFAGLATAAALDRIAGIPHVIVLERMGDTAYYDTDCLGAAAQLGPNGLLALQLLAGEDFVEQVLNEGHVLTNVGVVLPGSPVLLIPDSSMEDTGMPQVLIRWGALRRLLQTLIPQNSIHTATGDDIRGYAITDTNSVFPVNSDGERVGPKDLPEPLLIVSADGIDSTFQILVRCNKTLFAGPAADLRHESNIVDNGRVNVKAVVQKDLDYDSFGLKDASGRNLPPGTALAYNTPTVSCFAGSAGRGWTYWAISVADHIDEQGTITKHFERHTAQTVETTKQELLDILNGMETSSCCEFAIELIESTPSDAIYVRRSEQLLSVGPTFVSKDSKVVRVGDAAHGMSPAYGQGANFAFEDAVTLALSIRNNDNIESALQDYSDRRVGRCKEMIRRSAERATKQANGEPTQDVFKWISCWNPEE